MTQQGSLDIGRGFGVVPVRAAQRLINDAVYDAKLQGALGGQVQHLGRLIFALRVAPQNGREALRRDDRVDGMFEH